MLTLTDYRHQIQRYSIPILSVIIALLLMLLLDPWISMQSSPFLIFFLSVTVSAWYGGIKPGLVATIFSALTSYYWFIVPAQTSESDLSEIVRLIIFVIECILISVLCDGLRQAKQRVENNLQSLQEKEIKLEVANTQVSLILESIAEGFFALDNQWNFTYINHHCEIIFGQSRQELLSKNIWQVLPEVDLTVYEQFHRALTEQISIFLEKEIFTQSEQYYEIRAYPVIEGEGLAVYILDVTEHRLANLKLKQVEESIKESERRLRRLNESNLFGVAFGNVAGEIHYANDYYLRMIGYTREELEAGLIRWDQITPPEWLYLDLKALEELKIKGVATAFEKEYFCKNGNRVPVLIGSAFLEEPYEEAQEIIGFFLDLTRLKEAEKALQRREEELRLIADATPALIAYVDANQCYRFNNRRYEQWFGISVEQIYGKSIKEFVGDTFYEKIRPRIEQVLKGEQVIYEEQIFLPNGESHYIRANYVPRLDSNGKVEGFVALISDLSDRKRIEDNLRESEERFRMMANNSPVMIWLTDETGGQTFVNQTWLNLTGRTFEQELGDGWTQQIHPDDVSRCLDIFLYAFDARQPFEMEYRIKAASGEYRWILDRGSPRFTPEGKFTGYIGSCIDVTERQYALEALRKSEEILQQHAQMLDLANDSIIICDLNEYIVYWNHGAERQYGWTKAEAEGQQINILLKTIFSQPLSEIHFVLKTQGYWQGELIQTKHDGSHIVVNSRWTLQYNSDGQPMAILEISDDITERKQVEVALRHSEERFRAIFEQAAVGMSLLNLEGRWLRVNQKLCEITGYDQEELLQKTFQEITYPEDLERDLNYVRQLLSGEIETYLMEKRYIRKDKSVIWVEITVSLVRDQSHSTIQQRSCSKLGDPKYFITVVEDIRERKQVEMALQERAKELMALNTVLASTTTMLQKRNQELDQFAYVVSHDLKAPLRAIANLSQWIEEDLEGQLPPDNQQQLQLLRQRVYRMENLINGVLEYSRIGRKETTIETFSVDDLLTDVIDSLSPPPTFTIEIGSGMPTLTTAKLFLAQVFSNLISNAINHNPRFDGHVWITVKELESFYEFAVSDDGKGIEPEFHQRIFGIFQTLEKSEKPESTGIGLAIVKKIVELQGGSISVESEVSQGTTFRFNWPK